MWTCWWPATARSKRQKRPFVQTPAQKARTNREKTERRRRFHKNNGTCAAFLPIRACKQKTRMVYLQKCTTQFWMRRKQRPAPAVCRRRGRILPQGVWRGNDEARRFIQAVQHQKAERGAHLQTSGQRRGGAGFGGHHGGHAGGGGAHPGPHGHPCSHRDPGPHGGADPGTHRRARSGEAGGHRRAAEPGRGGAERRGRTHSWGAVRSHRDR